LGKEAKAFSSAALTPPFDRGNGAVASRHPILEAYMEFLRDLVRRGGLVRRWAIAAVVFIGAGPLLLGGHLAGGEESRPFAGGAQDGGPGAGKKLPSGIYGVAREGLKEKDVQPIKDNETIVVQNHRYLKKDDKEPRVFLVVHRQPDIPLVLSGAPKVVKDEQGGLQIHLKLHPDHAKTMEQFTKDKLGTKVAVIVDGEVVTTHTVRSVITGGELQITNCNKEAGTYLLKKLQELADKK
jgi:hypothetical protein